jgi:hypothetical protein
MAICRLCNKGQGLFLQTLTNTSTPQDSLCEKTTIFLKNMIDEQQYVIDSLQRELNKRTTAQR